MLALALILTVAMVARGVLLYRAPLFVRHDSIAYLQTGYELARGHGFDLPQRRTPLYPAFLGAVIWSLGEDPRAIAFAQHALGLLTIAATYLLARELFGRAAALFAALLVAISAPLLIYEHYILAEPVFIPLLVSGCWLAVRSLGQRANRGLFVAGVLLALAALARPIGQAALFAVPVAVLAQQGSIRRSLRPWLAAAAGIALVLVPWMARSLVVQGEASAGALGQTLVGRIVRHDEGFVLPSPTSPSRHTDPTAIAVRQLILTQMARDARPSAINHRVRSQFGLTEREANAAMQDVAIEIFRSQPERYVEGTIAKFRRLIVGEDERLRFHWATSKDGELRDDWLAEPSIAHLYAPPTALQERGYPSAELVTRVFQPYLWRWVLGPVALVGLAFGLRRERRAASLLLVGVSLALVVPSAALVGYVPRYRYPTDPLIAVFVAGGAVSVLSLIGAAFRRAGRGRVAAVPAPS